MGFHKKQRRQKGQPNLTENEVREFLGEAVQMINTENGFSANSAAMTILTRADHCRFSFENYRRLFQAISLFLLTKRVREFSPSLVESANKIGIPADTYFNLANQKN